VARSSSVSDRIRLSVHSDENGQRTVQPGPETLVVTGAHGTRGGIPGLLIGSVSAQVAAYARGPVVIERGHWGQAAGYQPGPVLAGADGSATAGAVLAFAADEATLRQAPLLVVSALADAPGVLGGTVSSAGTSRAGRCSGAKHPDLQIQCQFADGPPQGALLTAAREAQLVVVGCRGRRGLPRTALGSVAQALLAHAPCPVGIVHEHQQSQHRR
jgi:nucleotide-binding universal stress UspA family protein